MTRNQEVVLSEERGLRQYLEKMKPFKERPNKKQLGAPGWVTGLSIWLLISASSLDLRVVRSSLVCGSTLGMEPTEKKKKKEQSEKQKVSQKWVTAWTQRGKNFLK